MDTSVKGVPRGDTITILHIIPSISAVHGGPSRAMAVMERALADAGASVTTLTADDDGPGRRLAPEEQLATANGARRVYVRKWTEFYKVAPGAIPWLWRHVRDYDVVHVHALFSFLSVAAAAMALWRGVPVIIRPLGTLTDYGVRLRRPMAKRISLALIEGPILRRVAAVQFTSRREQEEAEALGLPLRAEIVPLGVESPPEGDPALLFRDYPQLANRPLVLFLSRIDPKKNVEGLLAAFARLSGEHSDVRLVIAGDGPADYVDRLSGLAESLGLSGRVTWLGHVEGALKAAAFAAADVFALPSYSENFGIAAVEAMLAGLPCVLGEGVAIAGDVAEAGGGVAVAPEPEAIAAALEALLGDAARRREMGAAARRFAENEYATRKMAERLIALYERVARRPGPAIAKPRALP